MSGSEVAVQGCEPHPIWLPLTRVERPLCDFSGRWRACSGTLSSPLSEREVMPSPSLSVGVCLGVGEMSRAASAIIHRSHRSSPQSRRFWKFRPCVRLGKSAVNPCTPSVASPREAVRSRTLAAATVILSRESSQALVSSCTWLRTCRCRSEVSGSQPARRPFLFGSALSVCFFRAMLSNKEQVELYTQGRRSWPRDSPSASSCFSPGL